MGGKCGEGLLVWRGGEVKGGGKIADGQGRKERCPFTLLLEEVARYRNSHVS